MFYTSHVFMVKSMWRVFESVFLTIRWAAFTLRPSGWWTSRWFVTSSSSRRSFQHWPAGPFRRGPWAWKHNVLLTLLSLHQTLIRLFACMCLPTGAGPCTMQYYWEKVTAFRTLWLLSLVWMALYKCSCSGCRNSLVSVQLWKPLVDYIGCAYLSVRSDDFNMLFQICPFSGNYPLTA